MPLNSELRIVWTAGVSVRTRCISKVQTHPMSMSAENINDSNAPVTASRLASSRVHRITWNRPFLRGTGNQSRSPQ